MPSPHVLIFGAVALGGIAALGYYIITEIQEQNRYEEYQRSHYQNTQSTRNRFRYTNDFDFEDDIDSDEEKTEVENDIQKLHIRNRRAYINDDEEYTRRRSIEREQYELYELERTIEERKRRLMAEQAFLDKEEEILRNRQNEVMRNEQILNESPSSSRQQTSTNEAERHHNSTLSNPFDDRFDASISGSQTEESHEEEMKSMTRSLQSMYTGDEGSVEDIEIVHRHMRLYQDTPQMSVMNTESTDSEFYGFESSDSEYHEYNQYEGDDNESMSNDYFAQNDPISHSSHSIHSDTDREEVSFIPDRLSVDWHNSSDEDNDEDAATLNSERRSSIRSFSDLSSYGNISESEARF